MSTVLFERRYSQLRRLLDRRLTAMVSQSEPKDLSAGLRYVLSARGKRVRSSILLLACEAVGGSVADALDLATAVEMMHNFTLVHDDIMDSAASRRGRPTVHTKWNVSNALLVGDVLLGLAYRSLLRTRTSDLRSIVKVFTRGFLDVCEGQALDLEFERRKHVSLSDYFRMIEKKTASLLSASAELGGLIGNGNQRQRNALRRFGHHLGRAFQVQDDLLDVVGKPDRFGKTIGGDILEGKKTFLLLKAAERSSGKDLALLHRLIGMKESGGAAGTPAEQRARVATVTGIYQRHGVIEAARDQIQRDTTKATVSLALLPANSATAMLRWFSEMLLKRTS